MPSWPSSWIEEIGSCRWSDIGTIVELGVEGD
jgi:hypothetical protein